MPYNLKCTDKLQLPKVKTTYLGIDTDKFMGEKVLKTIPLKLKNSDSLQVFKSFTKLINAMPATADYVKYFILLQVFYCKLYLHCNIICILL